MRKKRKRKTLQVKQQGSPIARYEREEMLEFGRQAGQTLNDWALNQICGHDSGYEAIKLRKS